MPKDTGNKCFACGAAKQHEYVKCLLGNREKSGIFHTKMGVSYCHLIAAKAHVSNPHLGQHPRGLRFKWNLFQSIENPVGFSWLMKIIRLLEPQKHPIDIQYCTQVQGIVLNRGGLNRQSLACFVAKNGQGGLRLLQCDLIKTIHENEGERKCVGPVPALPETQLHG